MLASDVATAELHLAPSWRTVAREQVLAIGLLLRVAGGLFGGVLALLVLITVRIAINARNAAALTQTPATISFAYSPRVCAVFVLVAVLFPLAVWQDEDPSRRTYHLAMPVSQSTHALIKVFAGWVWLMLATTLFLLCVALIHVVTQRITGTQQPYQPHFVWWEWLVPFTAATIGYALSSAAAVATRRPIVWLLAVVVLYFAVGATFDLMGMRTALWRLDRTLHGFFGVMAALGGEITWGPNEALFRPSLSRWLGAAAAWAVGTLVLLVVVSRVRPDAK